MCAHVTTARLPSESHLWDLVGAEQLAAQKAAVEAAFENVDFDKLQAAWKDFTLGLEDPRAKK